MSSRSSMDLTKGSILKNIIYFAVPMLLSSLVQQLYNTVDLIYVGQMIGTSASAAVGASALIITCLVGFFSGMSVGSGVVIAKAFGAEDEDLLSRAIHCTAAFCIVGGLALTAAGYILAPFAIKLMNTPAHLQQLALGYMRIYFISFPSILAFNLGAGVMRALGDSKSPLIAQFCGGIINVIMDYILIRFMANGVNGVALSSLFSQTVAAALVFHRIASLDDAYALRAHKIAFDKHVLKEMLSIGIPTGIQSMLVTVSNLIIQFHINSLGEASIAAFTAYFKAEMPVFLPQVAFGQAIMTYVGQNLGARKLDRIKKGLRGTTILSICVTVATCTVLLYSSNFLFGIFSHDPNVITDGQMIISVTFPFYFVYCFIELYSGVLRGLGTAKPAALIALANFCILRPVLLCVLVPLCPTVRCIAIVYPITWITTAISLRLCLNRQIKIVEGTLIHSRSSQHLVKTAV